MSDLPLYAITGANGFIGHRLVEWFLLQNAARVRPLVRTYAGLARLARFQLDCRVVDATNEAGLAANLQGCEVLFHCVVGDRDTILKSVEAAYQACVRAKVRRLVYLSSAVVHGNIPAPDTRDYSELVLDQPFEYNVSKVLAEHRLRELQADDQVEVVTLRPCIVYGPRSKWWTAQIAEDMLQGRAYLLDGGTGICNTVYIDNLAEAMYLAANSEHAAGEEYLITDGEHVTWWDLYNSIAESLELSLARVVMLDSAPLAAAAKAAAEAAAAEAAALVSEVPAEEVPPSGGYRRLLYAVKKAARTVLPFGRPEFPNGLNGQPALENPPEEASAGPMAHEPTGLQPDWETASLQCCQVLLPIDKARTDLGYNPYFSFAEGSRLTAEWLRFAYGLS